MLRVGYNRNEEVIKLKTSNFEYTERDLKVKSGEIPLSSCSGHYLRFLYQRAVANDDTELVKLIEARRLEIKEEMRVKSIERWHVRYSKRKSGTFQWKQPKSNNYTEHQQAIVRGEIPLEQVHTKELIHIHLKAQNLGDIELSERLLDLIMTRRADAEARHERAKRVKTIPSDVLSYLGRAIISGEVDYTDYSAEVIKRFVVGADEEGNKAIEMMLDYLEHPNRVYVCNTHAEALNMIEEMIGIPIRRPNEWF